MTASALKPGPILLLGANGQVGHALRRDLAPLGPVVALDLPDIDITDASRVTRLISELKPGIVVNAAAYTAVDKAEAEPEVADRVNAAAVGVIAEASRNAGAFLVHYSTEYVFDGTATVPYSPGDTPNPLSAYGRSKLAGEQALLAVGGPAVLFRTSWVFGPHGGNFVKTILRLAGERDELRVVADQVGQPAPAELVSSVTALFLYRMMTAGMPLAAPKIHHVTSNHPVTWHAFACAIVEQAATAGFKLRTAPERIVPIETRDYPLPARRPANSRLDTRLLESELGIRMPDWRPYLARMLQDLRPPAGG